MLLGALFHDIIFTLQLLDQPGTLTNIIILGLYPPADSDANLPHDNATSRSFGNMLGHWRFVWIDLFSLSPVGQNQGNISLQQLHKYCQNPSVINDFSNRFGLALLRESRNRCPLVFIGGLTVASCFTKMVALGLINRCVANFGDMDLALYLHVASNVYFLATSGPHLCAQLMARNSEGPKQAYDDICGYLRVLSGPNLIQRFFGLGNLVGVNLRNFEQDFNEAFILDDAVRAERLRIRRVRSIFLTNLLFDNPTGWFSLCYRTLRNYITDDGYYTNLLNFIHAVGRDVALLFLKHTGFISRWGDKDFRDQIKSLIAFFPDTFHYFLKEAFFSRIVDSDTFLSELLKFITLFPTTYHYFLKEAFLSRLVDSDTFLSELLKFIALFPTTYHYFLKDAFLSRLVDSDTFLSELLKFITLFPTTYHLFMKDSFFSRIADDALFLPALLKFITLFPTTYHLFMKNSFLSRLVGDASFLPALLKFINDFPHDFQKMMNDSFFARVVDDPEFIVTLYAFIDLFHENYASMLTNKGLVSRINEDKDYLPSLILLGERFPETAHTLLRHGLDSRLTNKVYMETWEKFYERYPDTIHHFQKSFMGMLDNEEEGFAFLDRFSQYNLEKIHLLLCDSFVYRRNTAWPAAIEELLKKANTDKAKKRIVRVICDMRAATYDKYVTHEEISAYMASMI